MPFRPTRRSLALLSTAALLLTSLGAGSLRAQGATTPGNQDAKAFVERFLREYNAQFAEAPERPADWNPLTRINAALAPELRSALEADRAASAANDEEIVGLDFDPFLNSQDPCETYTAGRTAERADTVMVEVLGACHGQNPLIPDAVYLLIRRERSFAIADIAYPQGASLRGVLRNLAEMRKQSPPSLEALR